MLKPFWKSSFLRFWFNDLLLALCAVPVTCLILRALNLRKHDHPPSAFEVLGMLLVWSVLFEWLGPAFLSLGTADLVDVAMYFAGGAIGWCVWRRRRNPLRP